MLISEHFIPWFETVNPEETIVFAAYSSNFAKKWGRLGRQHINEHPELGLILSPDQQSTSEWGIVGTRGTVIFRGAGGSIVGEGGNGVTDDPVSGEEEASNPEQLEKLWSWINGVWKNRIQTEKIQILVQTRWAYNDPTGKYKDTEDHKWFWVNLPALAYDDVNEDGISIDVDNGNRPDPMGRKPGEALCPEMYDEEWLEDMRKSAPYWFSALYQGRPSSADSEMFPEFNHYKLSDGIYTLYLKSGKTEIVGEARCYRFATMDLAATEKKSSDYTVFMVWDVTPSRKMVIRHIERVQIKSSDHKNKTYEWAAKWGVRWVGIESSTYGITLLQHMIAEGKLQVRKLAADKDKFSRALVGADMLANEQIFSALDAEWTGAFELEMKRFRKQTHDDQVDAFAYGALQLASIPTVWEKVTAVVTKISGYAVAKFPTKKKRKNDHGELGSWY
jgi:predicted phage terminase large subunit-like protein